MKAFLFAGLACLGSIFLSAQSVGVGTTAPHNSSILDISSTNKGLLLPRIADTTNISGPAAGLFIYNQNTNSPHFFDGSKWQNLFNSILSATGDSITYTVFGWASPGTIINYSQGASSAGGAAWPQVQDFSFIKYTDINSTEFKKRLFSGQVIANIEFKCYLPGTTTLYFSIKLYDFRVLFYRVNGSVSDKLIEEYSLNFTKIGFKDWINNIAFGYDLNTHIIGAY